MKTLIWNCRGLGNPGTVQGLSRYVTLNNPDLVFISETRLRRHKVDSLRRRLNMEGALDVARSENCVGLLLMWKDTLQVNLLSFSNSHIDVEVIQGESKFRFTGMYGTFYRQRKHEDWELLDRLRNDSNLPWLLGGDLNDILCWNERAGGRRKSRVEMDCFRDALERNGLWDIKPSRGWFTWHHGDIKDTHIKQRLDRFVATIDWLHLFGQCEIATDYSKDSDHCFLLLDTERKEQRDGRHDDQFRFDMCWADEEDCLKIVNDSWHGTEGTTLEKLKGVGTGLNAWQSQRRRANVRDKNRLKQRVERLLDQSISDANLEELKRCKQELKEVLNKEEIYWRQRSRVKWLKEGDRNTSFFHARANKRRKRNTIKGITDDDGNWVEGEENVARVARDFFSSLFQSNNEITSNMILQAVENCVTQEMNDKLCADFTVEEVHKAFFQIHPNKAPGIDGLPASFFRKFWNVLNVDFTGLCLDLLNGRICMSEVNQTVIVLIPKIDEPTLMKHFRPISLCNVIYKTCSKVLVNRLKSLMPTCIAENQSAFVAGRLISDNVIIAHELFHYLKGSKNGPNKGVAIKLDMEKAYDRVEWHFLVDIMTKMGFASSWIDTVMSLVSTVSYCFKINGTISDSFRPSRGLRQGDPLSPYLFLFCTQGLSAMLLEEQRMGRIKGVKASMHGPRVNHLLYADDCLLFIKNSKEEALRLKHVLSVYERSSGQKINAEKSSLYFSNGMSSQCKSVIIEALEMREEQELGHYLGLPLIVGKNKTEALGFLGVKVEKRMNNWTKSLLSFGGREVFIKSVAQAIPAYAMSCFLLPDCILDPIVSSTRKYWWSGKANERGWTHVAWQKVCLPKRKGGIGFRDLKLFNLALLAKQVWRLLCFNDSLCFKVLSSKYFPHGNVLEARHGDRPSFIWSGIFKAKEAIKEGFHWRIGTNSNVRMFQDKWGASKPISLEGVHVDNALNPVTCGDFMIHDLAAWNVIKVHQVFAEEDALSICRCPISPSNDLLVWGHHSSGCYTTRSGYSWLINRRQDSSMDDSFIWKAMAKIPTLPKIRIFGWRLCHDAFPTGHKLVAAGLSDGKCKMCNQEIETCLHAFRECSTIKEAFDLCALTAELPNEPFPSCKVWLEESFKKLKVDRFTLLIVLLWNMWNRRNKWAHDNKLLPIKAVVDYALLVSAEYVSAREHVGTMIECRRDIRWTRPLGNEIKINVDAAFMPCSGIATVGVIARNSHGLVLDARAHRLQGAHSAETAEACAFSVGIKMAIENEWHIAIIEGDAIAIVSKLNAEVLDRSTAATHLTEAHSSLIDHPGLSVVHVGREANRVAHSLAHWALNCNDPFTFSYDVPDCINDSVINDAIYG